MYVKIVILVLIVTGLAFLACKSPKSGVAASDPWSRYPVYTGNDLGMAYAPGRTTFKLWAPTAQAVRLQLYAQGDGGAPLRTVPLKKGEKGVWSTVLEGDQKGLFYTVQVQREGRWLEETPDPYARAVGVNGRRGQIIHLADTDPEGWAEDNRPPLAAPNDIILYELHVRDLSSHPNSGIRQRGQYLGLTERGTKSPEGLATGLDHLVEMGVTHVHLLPVFDFRSIDESLPADRRPYNWGYDPEHYNVPEGSYASDPNDGAVRIREFKQMVQALHQAGIRVVMDVVYNHTGSTDQSVFNRVEPGYYYRQRADGSFSDASACGNETASERPMMRQYMLESVLYWAREYHIDGFRFDLMGIHDIETMNQISRSLHAFDPDIFLYGEGWTAGGSPLPDSVRALKANTARLDRIAAFSDDMRDGIKGHVFTHDDRGFVSGKAGLEPSVRFGIVASTRHPQVDYDKVNYSKAPWAAEPFQTITYASCHDNHTLWDRLALSCADAGEADRIRMQKLAAAIVLTSQGVPFLHAGSEFCRSKDGVENSFQSADSINRLDWSRKARYREVNDYFRDLIRLRKNHPAFRLQTAEAIRTHLVFLSSREHDNFIAYRINNHAGGDRWKTVLVLLNGGRNHVDYPLPPGTWTVVADQYDVNEKGLRSMRGADIRVPAISAMVLFEE